MATQRGLEPWAMRYAGRWTHLQRRVESGESVVWIAGRRRVERRRIYAFDARGYVLTSPRERYPIYRVFPSLRSARTGFSATRKFP